MKATRSTPLAINLPDNILGIPLLPLCVILFVCYLFAKYDIRLGFAVGIAIGLVAKRAFQKDHRILQTIWIAARWNTVYDPIKRKLFICTIRKGPHASV